MTQVVNTFISGKYYIMYLFLRRFVRFRLIGWPILKSHSKKIIEIIPVPYVDFVPSVVPFRRLDRMIVV